MPVNIMEKRIMKAKDSIDLAQSEIKHISSANGIFIGQVKSKYTKTVIAFTIQKGIITCSDLLDSRSTKFSFTYSQVTGEYKGIGTRTNRRLCEDYICYVLILLRQLTANQKEEA